MSAATPALEVFMTPAQLLDHWQGHRRLTRRVIEAFPDAQFTTFSVGGMRSFGLLAVELLRMAAPTVQGVLTDSWTEGVSADAKPKAEVLRLWDESTARMNELWPKIPSAHFQRTITAFGQYTMRTNDLIMYCVDNEIHHRGQGYVYLRALGIEPPAFWERG
ncbi:MAG TPA: DinB family protein [Gemmatimonadaceae bacterium]